MEMKKSLPIIQFVIMLVIMLAGFVSAWAVQKERIATLKEETKRDSEIIRQLEKDVAGIKEQNKIIIDLLKEIRRQ